MQRCQKCLVPDTFPNTTIGTDGICNRCKEHTDFTYKGTDTLKTRLLWREGPQYDCVVPISGGKDSTYALWVLRKEMGLRTLAVNHHNRMTSPMARDNINRICEALDVDLLVVQTETDTERKFVYHFLKAMVPLGISWGICTFCFYAIGSAVYRAATRHDIPSIAWAVTPYEMRPFFPTKRWDEMKFSDVNFNIKDHFKMEFGPFLVDPLKKNASPLKLMNAARHLSLAMYYLVRQRTELYVPPFSNFFGLKPKLKDDRIKEFMLYQYVEYDARKIEETLRREIAWTTPAERASTERYDCMVGAFNDVRWRNAYNVSMNTMFAAEQQRAGLVSRKKTESVIRESFDNNTYRKRMQNLFDAIGMRDLDIDDLLGAEPVLDLPEPVEPHIDQPSRGCARC